jgi:uncharacterized protein involved in response to NO
MIFVYTMVAIVGFLLTTVKNWTGVQTFIGTFCIVGFGFKILSYFVTLPPNLDIHSFAFGIGLITISMMSRVSLGHTGNDVFNPPKKLNLIFALLLLSFIFRVVFPILNRAYYHEWVLIAQALWIAAFMGFLLIYTPLFFKPRIDGQFG